MSSASMPSRPLPTVLCERLGRRSGLTFLEVEQLRPMLPGMPVAELPAGQRLVDGVIRRPIVTVEDPMRRPGGGIAARCSMIPPSFDRSPIPGQPPRAMGKEKVEVVAAPGCRITVHDDGWTGWLRRQVVDDGFPIVSVFRVLDASRLPPVGARVATHTTFLAADWVREPHGRAHRMHPVAPEDAWSGGRQVVRVEEQASGVQFVVWPNGKQAEPFYVRARFSDVNSGAERIWYGLEEHGSRMVVRIVATPEVTVESFMPAKSAATDWGHVLQRSALGDPTAYARDRLSKTGPVQVAGRFFEAWTASVYVDDFFVYNEASAADIDALPPLRDAVDTESPAPAAAFRQRGLPKPGAFGEALAEGLGISSAAAGLLLNLPLMIPPLSVVGDVYDALDLYAIASTGLDIEGRHVSTLQAVFLGIFALAASAAVIKSGRRVLSSMRRNPMPDEMLDELVEQGRSLDDLRRRIEDGQELTPEDTSRLRRALAAIEEARAAFVNRIPLTFDSLLDDRGFRNPWLEHRFAMADFRTVPGEGAKALRKRWLRSLDEGDEAARSVLVLLGRAMGERALAIERVAPHGGSDADFVDGLRRYIDALADDLGGGYGRVGWSWDHDRFPVDRIGRLPEAQALLRDWRPGLPIDAPHAVLAPGGRAVARVESLSYGVEIRRRYWSNLWEAEWRTRHGPDGPAELAGIIAQAPAALQDVLRRRYVDGQSPRMADYPRDLPCPLDNIEDLAESAPDWFILYQRARLEFRSVAGGGPSPLTRVAGALQRIELNHRSVPHRFYHRRLLRAFSGMPGFGAMRDALTRLSRATHPDNLEPLHRLEHGFVDPFAVNRSSYAFVEQASEVARQDWLAYARRVAAHGDEAYVREASGLSDDQVRELIALLRQARSAGGEGFGLDELSWLLNQEILQRGLHLAELPSARPPLDLINPGGQGQSWLRGLPTLREARDHPIEALMRQSEQADTILSGIQP